MERAEEVVESPHDFAIFFPELVHRSLLKEREDLVDIELNDAVEFDACRRAIGHCMMDGKEKLVTATQTIFLHSLASIADVAENFLPNVQRIVCRLSLKVTKSEEPLPAILISHAICAFLKENWENRLVIT